MNSQLAARACALGVGMAMVAIGCASQAHSLELAAATNRCEFPARMRERATQYEAEINLVRTQPAAYADIVDHAMASLDASGAFVRAGFTIQTQEGRAAVDEAVAALRRQRPLAPLVLNSCLSVAAQGHAHHLGQTGDVGHVGPGGSSPSQRASQAFGSRLSCGETVSAGPGNTRDHVIALLIDDGIPDRGHRKALLDASYRTLGAGQAAHVYGTVSVQVLCLQQLPG